MMLRKRKVVNVWLACAVFAVLVFTMCGSAIAAAPHPNCPFGTEDLSGNGVCLPITEWVGLSDKPAVEVLSSVLNVILSVVAGLAILVIIIAGIMYMTSGGDERRTELAFRALTWAVVGLAVAALSYAIVALLSGLFGAG